MRLLLKYKILLLLFFKIIFIQSAHGQKVEISNDSLRKIVVEAGRAFEKLDNKSSLEYSQKALNLAYETQNYAYIARIYNLLGLNYTEFTDYRKAEDAYLKGIDAAIKANELEVESWLDSNLATLYQVHFKQHDKALDYHLKSLAYSKKIESDYDILLSYLNITILFFDIDNYKDGIVYLNKADDYIFKINEGATYITYYSLYALYYNHFKNYEKAEESYLLSLKYCEDNRYDLQGVHAMELYDDIAHFYAAHNDKNKGYDYLVKHLTLKDSLYSVEKTETIANYATKIDLDSYKREISAIEKKNEQQQQTIFYSRIIFVLLIFLALTLVGFVAYLVQTQKQKNNLILEIEQNNKLLAEAKAEAERLSESKSQFIGKVSHELRTPLYGVIGLANILEQDFPILKNNKILNSLNFSANYLMNLINDLLQMQKIEANAVKVEKNVYNINHEIKHIRESLNTIAHRNKNEIITSTENFEHELVEVDKLKLNQILYNLISNALKFTTEGRVTIHVKQKVISSTVLSLEYAIEDTGNGISEENLAVIFDRFSQFHTQGTDYQGTGLGLSIVKQLIDLLGGAIKVESTVGKGTIFTFSIPCKVVTTKDVSYKASDISKQLATMDLDILLVENNEINRLVNKRNFENHQIACTLTSSAKEAIDLLEDKKFSIILTDINMPEIDGFEFVKILREKGIYTPVIALTAYTREDIMPQLSKSDIQDVVTKPFDFEHLLRAIYNILKV